MNMPRFSSIVCCLLCALSVTTAIKITTNSEWVQLDLSGRLETHLLGPSYNHQDDDETITRPVFVTDRPLSIHISVDYDLQQQLQGQAAPILASKLTWWRGSINKNNHSEAGRAPRWSLALQRRSRGTTVLTATAHAREPTTVWRAQCGSSHHVPTQVLYQRQWNDRFETACALVGVRRLGPSLRAQERDWWIPQTRVTLLGNLQSHWDLPHRDHCQVRLTIKRRMGWSLLGKATDTDDAATWCSLRLDAYPHPLYSTSAVVSGRVLDRSSWTLSWRHNAAVGRMFGGSRN